MSSKNPFTAAEKGEQSGKKQANQQTNPQPVEGGQSPQQPVESADPERVDELEKELEDLRDRVEDAEPPVPDFDCSNDSCEGFAVEEIQPGHIVTKNKLIGSSTFPKMVYCPRCGERMKCSELFSKEEQKGRFGQKPPISNNKSAGRALREVVEKEDREEVLEKADSKK
jgi:hypothetical protein